MAGYRDDEPRNWKGEWTGPGKRPKGAPLRVTSTEWPTLDHPALAGTPKVSGVLSTGKVYEGRPRADFKVKPEQRGKPRTLFQQAPTINPSTPASQRITERSYLKQQGLDYDKMKNIVKASALSNDPLLQRAARQAEADLAKAARAVSQIKEGFSNLPRETTRMNRNIGKAPKGMSKEATPKVNKIIRNEQAHRAKMMEVQRNNRSTKDALVDKILSEPGDLHYYRVGSGPRMATINPRAKKTFDVLERGFNALEKWFK